MMGKTPASPDLFGLILIFIKVLLFSFNGRISTEPLFPEIRDKDRISTALLQRILKIGQRIPGKNAWRIDAGIIILLLM